jgi:hypothetical protein
MRTHRYPSMLAIATISIAISCLSISGAAQSQPPPNARCPQGYWLMESVCVNQETGDVVAASPAAPARAVLDPGCAPGYWRYGRLCLSPSTGDVELVDEKMWPPERRAEVKG